VFFCPAERCPLPVVLSWKTQPALPRGAFPPLVRRDVSGVVARILVWIGGAAKTKLFSVLVSFPKHLHLAHEGFAGMGGHDFREHRG